MRETAYKIYLNTLSKILKTPPYLILFVSDKCWTHCNHCWFNEEWKSNMAKADSLTFNEIDNISQSIKKLLFLSITGGEAFMRDDITDIVNLFTKKNKVFRYQIPTSGFDTETITSASIKMLSENRHIPFRVDVSLDGTEKTHDKIRNRKGTFQNAVLTIKELNKIKSFYSYFDVGVITTVSSENQNELDELAGIISKIHGSGEWLVNITRGKTRDPKAGVVDNNNYYKVQNIIEQRIKDGSYIGHSGHLTAKWLSAKNSVRRDLIKDILENKHEGGGCSAGSIGGVIYGDGSVYPCELLNESFGNLREFDFNFNKLWNSEKAISIRNKIQVTRCLCTQECFLSTNFLVQPGLWFKTVSRRLKLN